jgi:ankyrin repeat protein
MGTDQYRYPTDLNSTNQHGADASACDGKGWSPLQLAYMNKDSTEEQLWSIMTELLAHGADVNCRTSKHTILDLAVGNGRWALAEKLSAMGATLSQGSALRTTPSPSLYISCGASVLTTEVAQCSGPKEQPAAMAAPPLGGQER